MSGGEPPTTTDVPIDLARLPVGAALRARREQLGWGLPEVAAWLRIRLPYLEALEGGQVSRLPGVAYATGFLRNYAAALGLDADDMVCRFRSETKDVARKPELSFPVPVPERGVPAGAIVLLGVVVVAAAYVGWYEFGGRLTRETHVVPPVPPSLTQYAGGAARSTSPQVATVMPGPGQAPSPLPPGGGAAAAQDTAAKASQPAADAETAGVAGDLSRAPTGPEPGGGGTQPSAAAVAPTAPGSAPGSASGPAALPAAAAVAPTLAGGTGAAVAPALPTATAPAAAVSATPAGATPAAAPGQVVLNAVAASWVQVRQPGGKVIYDHVMQPGEHWPVPTDAGALVLNTGNAGGITLSADGTTSPVLGRIGAVRRGIPLATQAVKDGTVAAGQATAGAAAASAVAGSAPLPATAIPATPAQPPRPRAAAHPAPTRAAPEGEDETDRLNQAQLKPPQ